MDKEFPMPDLAKREENFYGGKIPSADDPFINEKKTYYIDLQLLVEEIEAIIQHVGADSMEDTLRLIFSHVYDFVVEYDENVKNLIYRSLNENESISGDVFEACFFISLCMFLHDSKRIDGMTQQEFVYKNDPREFNNEESPYYLRNPNHLREKNYIAFNSTYDKFRQDRSRLFSARPVHNTAEWAAVRMDSEYEWILYFIMNPNDEKTKDLRKTYDRIRNLYNGIDAVMKLPAESLTTEKLEEAYNKFLSKLKKIKYENYLELIKFCLEHICKDKTFYGINLYRLEKELQPFKLTNEVNRLLACKSEDEERIAVIKFLFLQDIPFPKIYEYFYTLENKEHVGIYSSMFLSLRNLVVQSSRLVIDKFVEDGLFGEDWIKFFHKTVNDLVPSVLYNPESIDYTVTPQSQPAFEKDLSYPVLVNVVNQVQILKSSK